MVSTIMDVNFHQTMIKLHELGFRPKEILDIGCNHGNWTRSVKQLYEIPIHMIDANDYKVIIANTKFTQAVLSNKEEEIDWYGAKTTGDSFFKEVTSHFDNVPASRVVTVTLDKLLEQKIISPGINFIKMDCQGAELRILEGASTLLPGVEVILSEMPFMGVFNQGAPKFIEYVNYMDSLGFMVYDIVELHKSRGLLTHIDIVFISKLSPVGAEAQKVINNFGKDGL